MNYPYQNFYPPPAYPPSYPNFVDNASVQNPVPSQPGMYPQIPPYPPYPVISPYPSGAGPVCPPPPAGGIYIPSTEFVIEPMGTPSYPMYPGVSTATQLPSSGGMYNEAVLQSPNGANYMPAYEDHPSCPQYPCLTDQKYFPSVSPLWNYKMPQGTVKYYEPFDPEEDAKILRKAMKGLGTNEEPIIDVLAHRTNFQRLQIELAYKTQFGRDLIEDLNSELSGRFEDVVLAVMTPISDYCAKELRHALSGAGTDEDVLIEILCSRENRDILEIKTAYKRLFDRSLEDDLKSDTSGDFRRLMVSMSTGARNEGFADPDQAKQDAQELYDAGEGQWGTDESAFNVILATRSWDHLSMVFYEYFQLTGHTIGDAIKREFSGDVEQGWKTVAHCVENRPSFFAQRIYKAMKGAGTEDRDLIRLIVTRCEIDLVQIKEEFYNQYENTMEEAIESDTSGDYKRMLIALVVGN